MNSFRNLVPTDLVQKISSVTGIAVNKFGNIIVADSGNNKTRIWSCIRSGSFVVSGRLVYPDIDPSVAFISENNIEALYALFSGLILSEFAEASET
ncbi:Uncharacterised protein [uncultured archaeon]|nr:Uncharacterised protein [uncultured archaeon]